MIQFNLVKPTILIIGGLLLGVGLTLFVLRFSSPEDTWICQDGQWVKHGAPIAPKPTTPCPGASPQPTLSASPVPSLTPTPSPIPSVDESDLIKQAVYAKTGLDKTKAEVTINTHTASHAKGNVKEFDAVGGAYWLATKTADHWLVVYDGQSTPLCSQIDPYSFPTSMASECLNSAGKLITR